MKIDYVILSSDDSYYLDFYEPVSKLWNYFGLKTLMFHITDNESDFEENKFGLYKKIKSISGYPTSWQSQLIRLYAYTYFENANLLTSDIDMIPLNGNFFTSNAENLSQIEVLNYSGKPYNDVPYFPICYILGNSNVMKQILQIEGSFENYLNKIKTTYTIKWNADENFLYDKLHKYSHLKHYNNRDFRKDRIDRSIWDYNVESIKNKKYIDSHMLKPYKKYQAEIDKIISLTLQNN